MCSVSSVPRWRPRLVVGAALVAPAQATPGPGQVIGAGDASAHPGAVRARITFTKRPAHPWDSRLAWDAWKQRADGSWRLVAHDEWRAGSGFPGRYTTNPCVKGHGWLPDGTYSLRQYNDYAGTLIHGRSFRLSDKRCGDGTLREELFIHTESGGRQPPVRRRPGRPDLPVGVPEDQRLHLPRVHQALPRRRPGPGPRLPAVLQGRRGLPEGPGPPPRPLTRQLRHALGRRRRQSASRASERCEPRRDQTAGVGA